MPCKSRSFTFIQMFHTHTHFYTQTLLHTDNFKHRSLYTDAFTHRRFYTQKLLNTAAFTHRRFYTLLHTDAFEIGPVKSQFYISFWRSILISHERVRRHFLQIAILLQFLAIEPHFVRKGCDGKREIAISGDRTSFRFFSCERVRRTLCKSQFYFSFWRSNLISCERVAPDALQIAILFHWRSNLISCERVAVGQAQIKIAVLPQFLAIEHHFARKGCTRTSAN